MSAFDPQDGQARSGRHALDLERLALDELPEARRRALEADLGPSELEAQRAALAEDSRTLLERLPVEANLRRIRARAEAARTAAAKRARRRAVWAVGAGLAAAAAAVLAVQLGTVAPLVDSTTDPETTRIKGLDPHLVLYRAEAGSHEVEALRDGAAVHAGDVVQLGYVAAGASHGVLLSIDGAGAVTLHSPAEPSGSTALDRDGEVLLDYAFALDAAPAFERFFFVSAPEPLPTPEILERARRLARDPGRAITDPLDLPEDWEQSSVLLNKE